MRSKKRAFCDRPGRLTQRGNVGSAMKNLFDFIISPKSRNSNNERSFFYEEGHTTIAFYNTCGHKFFQFGVVNKIEHRATRFFIIISRLHDLGSPTDERMISK